MTHRERKIVNVSLADSLIEQVRELLEETGLSKLDLVRAAIQWYLSRPPSRQLRTAELRRTDLEESRTNLIMSRMHKRQITRLPVARHKMKKRIWEDVLATYLHEARGVEDPYEFP